MGENLNNGNVTESVLMPNMSMESEEFTDENNEQTSINIKTAGVTNPNIPSSIFGTSSYQMVVGKRNASIQRLEEYRLTKPAIAKQIENFVEKFDYKNPAYIEMFANEVMGENSVKSLTEYIKGCRNEEAYEDIRVMLLDFIEDIEAKPAKKTLLDRLKGFIEKRGEKASLSKLETARLEEVIEIMEKKTQASLIEISTKNRAEISKFLNSEQKKALQIDMYVIAGELILKKIEEEYLPVFKTEYEKDPTSVEKKLAYKEAEERAIDFLAKLNNVLTTSAITLINVDTLLKEKEINKKTEVFLKDILGHTIPILTQQCAIRIIDRKNQIPIEEATKIQQITEQIFVENAKQVSDMYVATVEQSGKPFISTDAVETTINYCKEAAQKAEAIKSEKFKLELEVHDKLERLNNEQKIVANELAFRTMSKTELEELQKTVDTFKPTI